MCGETDRLVITVEPSTDCAVCLCALMRGQSKKLKSHYVSAAVGLCLFVYVLACFLLCLVSCGWFLPSLFSAMFERHQPPPRVSVALGTGDSSRKLCRDF